MAILKPIATTQGPVFGFNLLEGLSKSSDLAASTAENIATGGNPKVYLSATQLTYVVADATATVPSGDVASEAAIPLYPEQPILLNIDGVTNLSVISDSAAKVSAIFFE